MEIQISFWTGVIGRWKKKLMILEKENIIILPPNKSINYDLKQIYSLLHCTLYDTNKNNVLRIDISKKTLFIRLNNKEDKKLIYEQIKHNIHQLQEKNAFSKDFKSYNDEIQKNQEEKGNFLNVQTKISELMNYFIEISVKINDFRTIIDSSKLSKEAKMKLTENHNNLNLIKDEMKIKFDDLIQDIFDYRDMNELLLDNSFNNNHNIINNSSKNLFNLNNTNNTNNINNNKSDFKENTKQLFSKAFTSFGGWMKDVGNKVITNLDKLNINNKVQSNSLEKNNEPPIQISNIEEGIKILENIKSKYQNQMSKNDLLTLHAIIDFYKIYKK